MEMEQTQASLGSWGHLLAQPHNTQPSTHKKRAMFRTATLMKPAMIQRADRQGARLTRTGSIEHIYPKAMDETTLLGAQAAAPMQR